MAIHKIVISTTRDKQVLDVTDRIESCLGGAAEGICNIFVCHTTAAITTGEAIEGTDLDLTDTLTHLIPRMNFRHAHNPPHAPDHMVSSIMGAGLTIPFRAGKLMMGTWQRVLLVERHGPREREIVVSVITG